MSPSPHLKMETDPVSEMRFLVFGILDDAHSPEIHHRQNPSDSTVVRVIPTWSMG
jgi:hypothetical protein